MESKMKLTLLLHLCCVALIGLAANPAHSQSVPILFGEDVLSCSPAPCVLPVTQIFTQRTTDAVISDDPVSPKNLLLGADEDSCGGAGGFELSTDGGSTWKFSTCMANVKRDYYAYGQPLVGYDLKGNAYIAEEFLDSNGHDGAIGAETSSDGLNWSPTRVALYTGDELDFSWLTIDTSPQSPRANSLYVSAIDWNQPLGNRTQVVSAHSTDSGVHWFPASVNPPQLYPAIDLWTNVATAKDGGVYVTWQHCAAGGPHAACGDGTALMLFSKSTDGGNTWSQPVIMATITLPPPSCSCGFGVLPNSNFIEVSNYGVMGVDKSNGPYAGTIYVTMYSWTGTYMLVQEVRSTDGGNTWSSPLPVAPPSATHDQFLPWISVSKSGLIGITWMDRRNDPANVKYQPFAAFSHDGGQSFGTNVLLSQKFSDPNIQKETYMGDYATNIWIGSTFLSAWMDSSNGVEMQDVVGGVKLH